jgi:hypothetical protein
MKANEASLTAALGRIKDVKVDEASIRAHVMRPRHLEGVISDRGREDAPLIEKHWPPSVLIYELNIRGFIDALESALTNSTAGYSRGPDNHGRRCWLAHVRR